MKLNKKLLMYRAKEVKYIKRKTLLLGLYILITICLLGMAPLKETEAKIEIERETYSTTIVQQEKEIVTPTPTFSQPSLVLFSEEIPINLTEENKQKINAQLLELEEEIIMLAKLIYREARGVNSTQEQAAVVWCVLNRFDSDKYGDTIKKVITARNQFAYVNNTPIEEEFYNLSRDVVSRWLLEKEGFNDVGRVLPNDYLFFAGSRGRNRFRQTYKSKKYWDWSLSNPYNGSDI